MEYLRLRWRDIEEYCKKLAKEIKKRNVKFDIIIGIARGGLVPARLLSDYLNNDELHVMRVKFYTDVGKTAEKPLILHATQFDIKGKRVLLVDDIADTGKSLSVAIDHLKKRGASSIFVVTLVKKPSSIVEPDMYIEETDRWVIFPWEVAETIRSIKSKGKEELKKANISEEEIKSFENLI